MSESSCKLTCKSIDRVLIVGGSSGIGLATALILAQAGASVIIAGRNKEKLQLAVQALPAGVKTLVMDASQKASVTEAFEQAGEIDHLVLASGSGRGVGNFPTLNVEDVRLGFEEKVFPHFVCAQAILPYLSEKGGITFVSAVSARASMPGTSGIAAANAAIAAWVPILARELAPRRVNAVAPGVIDTPWWDFLSEEQKNRLFTEYAQLTPVGRVGEAADIAGAIYFLITNTFINGQMVICDGGLSLGMNAA